MSGRKLATSLSATAVALAFGALVISGTAWAGGGSKFECDGEQIDGPRSMDGKLEKREGRARFSATIESDVSDIGTVVSVLVGGVQVDTIQLEAAATGSTGEVNYDTNPEDDEPFPGSFNPNSAGAGTEVKVGGVDCDLQEN